MAAKQGSEANRSALASAGDTQASTTTGIPEGREGFSNRLGFLLISAGCAIGLGNIWRFPYITGEYGGAAHRVFLGSFGLACIGDGVRGRSCQLSLHRTKF